MIYPSITFIAILSRSSGIRCTPLSNRKILGTRVAIITGIEATKTLAKREASPPLKNLTIARPKARAKGIVIARARARVKTIDLSLNQIRRLRALFIEKRVINLGNTPSEKGVLKRRIIPKGIALITTSLSL